MDFDLPAEDDPRRSGVRAWLKEHPNPTADELLDVGYEVPHWPPPWGLSADPEFQLIISQELQRAGVERFGNLLSATNLGPALLAHGTEEAKEKYLRRMLTGKDRWCQLQSEPSAGSDLAALRSTAVRDGDHYVINGQKIWSNAGSSDYGMMVVRTDPNASKHAGLSLIIVDMKSPGITARPIDIMSQAPKDLVVRMYETFFDNVKVPASNLIGKEGEGWRLTQQVLQAERMMILQHMQKPTARDLVVGLVQTGRIDDPSLTDEAASLYIEGEIIRLMNLRAMSDQLNARRPGPEAAIIKMMGAPHDQHLNDFAKRLEGQAGLLPGGDAFEGKHTHLAVSWDAAFWDSPTLTLRAGSQELMLNVIAERIIGLPRERDPSAQGNWSENQRALRAEK